MLLLRKVKALFTSRKDENSYVNEGNCSWVYVDEVEEAEMAIPDQNGIGVGWVPPEEPDYEGYYSDEESDRLIPTSGRRVVEGEWVDREYLESDDGYGMTFEGVPQMGPPQIIGEVDNWRFERELHIFTDGSHSADKSKSGYGIYAPQCDSMNRAVLLDSPHCIDRAEIQAIIQALMYIFTNIKSQANSDLKDSKIVIFTDSETTIRALHHIRGERESWKPPKMPYHLRDKLPNIIEKYRKELNILLTLAERFNEIITISHVRSHMGIDGNEWADLFAKMSTMTVQRALRSKSFDMARKSDRIWPSRSHVPYITIKPSIEKKNISLLMLDIDDESNRVLFPRQQVVWDEHHSTTLEELFEDMEEFTGKSWEERHQGHFNYYF